MSSAVEAKADQIRGIDNNSDGRLQPGDFGDTESCACDKIEK
jgi:hypothetical protein